MVKHCSQLAKNECGIACLKIFYDLYEVEKSYNDLLNKIEVKEEGISIDALVNELQSIGNFKAYEIEKENLKNMCPAIIVLKKKEKSHFVVIYKYEEGCFYVSDPNNEEIKKIKESKIYKFFSGYIIFHQKREIEIPNINYYEVEYGNFSIPFLILSLLEVLLITYSMLYLFSIQDFTAFKIYYFLIILFISCLISLLKNICLNSIEKSIDEKTISLKIKDDFIKGKTNNINDLKLSIQNGYLLKGELIRFLTLIIPNVFIIIGSLIYFFYINKLIFVLMLFFSLIVFLTNFIFTKIKNKKMNNANIIENRLNLFENKMLTKETKNNILDLFDKIKLETSKYLSINQITNLIMFIIKQFSLMLILILMYMLKINVYAIFVITFYFYSFEGIIEISSYLAKYKYNKILKKRFLSE